MATTSRKSSKNRPTDKRSSRQDLVTTSPPPRKWTPILWSRSTRTGKSRSSGRNGHDRPSESALAREIRGIVLLLLGIFLAGALAAEGYTQLHGNGNVRGNFGWVGALLAHPIALLLGGPPAAPVCGGAPPRHCCHSRQPRTRCVSSGALESARTDRGWSFSSAW